MDVCLVLLLCCLPICVCVCLQVQGPLRECRSIWLGFRRLPSYCAPLICVSSPFPLCPIYLKKTWKILIFGNKKSKSTRSWNQHQTLNECLLFRIQFQIRPAAPQVGKKKRLKKLENLSGLVVTLAAQWSPFAAARPCSAFRTCQNLLTKSRLTWTVCGTPLITLTTDLGLSIGVCMLEYMKLVNVHESRVHETGTSSVYIRVQNWRRLWKLVKSTAVSLKVQPRNTETIILRGFLFFAVPEWDFRNAGTFSQDLFYP